MQIDNKLQETNEYLFILSLPATAEGFNLSVYLAYRSVRKTKHLK